MHIFLIEYRETDEKSDDVLHHCLVTLSCFPPSSAPLHTNNYSSTISASKRTTKVLDRHKWQTTAQALQKQAKTRRLLLSLNGPQINDHYLLRLLHGQLATVRQEEPLPTLSHKSYVQVVSLSSSRRRHYQHGLCIPVIYPC